MGVDICLFKVLCEKLTLGSFGNLERGESFMAVRSGYVEALLDNSLIQQLTIEGVGLVHATTYDMTQVGIVQMPC